MKQRTLTAAAVVRLNELPGTARLESRRFPRRRRCGQVLIYSVLLMSGLMAVGSLAVDLARVQLARTQLQTAADAAARAGAASLLERPGDAASAVAAATSAAAFNAADGKPVALSASDVQVGNYDESASLTFVAGRLPLNAVRTVARRDRASGNPVPLSFAKTIGMDAYDVSAAAVARSDSPASGYGIAGTDRVSFASIGVLAQMDGRVVSNGDINVGWPLGLLVRVDGDVRSYGGTVRRGVLAGITGSTAALTDKLNFPSVRLPAADDNAKLGSWLSSGGDFTTLLGARIPAGTYVVRNLTLLAGLAVDVEGPVTFYVTGDVNIAAGVNLFGSMSNNAANFKVRVTKGGRVNFLADLLTPLYMDVYAPDSDIIVAVGVNHYTGRLVGKSLDVCLPVLGRITEDPSLAPATPGGVTLVK